MAAITHGNMVTLNEHLIGSIRQINDLKNSVFLVDAYDTRGFWLGS